MNDKEFLKKIGGNISRIRKTNGMTQADLCALINMEIPNLSAIENGRQNASSLTLKKIADSLEVKVSALLENL